MKKEVKNEKNVAINVASKPNKTSRIFSIVLVVLVSVIAATIILCTFIPKNYNFGIQSPTFIKVYPDKNSDASITGTKYDKGTDVYNKITSLYTDSFNSSILGALFQGKAFNSLSVKEGYKGLDDSTIKSGSYVVFFYDKTQTLTINGHKYNADIVSDTDYIEVVIEVKDSNSLTEVNAYFKYKATGTNDYSYVRFVSYAAQSNLYDYLNDIK